MAGYGIKGKNEAGEIIDLPLAAQYDGNGEDISETYSKRAFDKIKVGDNTIEAAHDDTITLLAGENVTLIADPSAKTIAISASGGGGGAANDISNATITFDYELYYDGTVKQQSVTIYMGEVKLEEGKDYLITGDLSGVEAGSYIVQIVGMDDYTGMTTKTWKINKMPITVNWTDLQYTYDGTAHKPSATLTDVYGNDVDYDFTITIDGEDTQTDAGTYTATAKLASIYDNNCELVNPDATFEIAKQPITVQWDGLELTFDGDEHTPTVELYTEAGDTIDLPYEITVGGAESQRNAGSYEAVCALDETYTNYEFVGGETTMVIDKAQPGIPDSFAVSGMEGSQTSYTIDMLDDNTISFTLEDTSLCSFEIDGKTITFTSIAEGDTTGTLVVPETDNYYGVTVEMTVEVKFISYVLEENTWDAIRQASDAGTAANFWNVGDTHSLVLNGTIGTVEFDNYETWVYIIGFDHNSELEGTNRVHFLGFKTAQFDGIDVSLIDSQYNSTATNGTKYFNPNHWGRYNYGGWAGCDLRYDVIGSTDVAPGNYGQAASSDAHVGYAPSESCLTNPVADTFMAAIPEELRRNLKLTTKYTNNTKATSSSDNTASGYVSGMDDYIWLLAEFEVFGVRSYANSYEQNYQEQYEYFSLGNSTIHYGHSATGTAEVWWTRGPYYNSSSNYQSFTTVNASGSANYNYASNSRALSPSFAL